MDRKEAPWRDGLAAGLETLVATVAGGGENCHHGDLQFSDLFRKAFGERARGAVWVWAMAAASLRAVVQASAGPVCGET